MSDKRFPGVTGNPWMSSSSEAIRYNENHDEHGQFSSGSGGATVAKGHGTGANHNDKGEVLKSAMRPNGKQVARGGDKIAGTTTEGKQVVGRVIVTHGDDHHEALQKIAADPRTKWGADALSKYDPTPGHASYYVKDASGGTHYINADKVSAVGSDVKGNAGKAYD